MFPDLLVPISIFLSPLLKRRQRSHEQQIAAADERANEILSHPTAGFSPWETEMRSDQSARDTLPGEIRAVHIPVEKQNKDQKSKLQNYFVQEAALQKLDREIAALQRRKDAAHRTLVMVEMEERRATLFSAAESFSPRETGSRRDAAILPSPSIG